MVLTAFETAARHARGDLDDDPLAWFSRPLAIFGGLSAFHAVQEREHFERAVLLQALALGPDAHPDAIDGLRHGISNGETTGHGQDATSRRPALRVIRGGGRDRHLRLWSSSAEIDCGPVRMQVFYAVLARHAQDVRTRIGNLYGRRLARELRITPGFDWSEPLANALVSEALAHTLTLAAVDPDSDVAAGLDVFIMQRFRG